MTFDLEKARKICNRCCAPFSEVTDEHVSIAMQRFYESLAEVERLQEFRDRIARVLKQPLTDCDDLLILSMDSVICHRRRQAARIKELEEALAEYQRLGKTISEVVVPCLTAHGNCDQCRPKAKAACDAIETIRKGKIGPDAALKKQWDDVLGTKPRSWQITEERKAALSVIGNMKTLIVCPHCKTPIEFADIPPYMAVLRVMLEEVGQ